jgi:AbrB family looped-hinge helix DNA binding protein
MIQLWHTGENMALEDISILVPENGRVVIPARVRKDLGLESGGELVLARQENGSWSLTTRRQRIEEAQQYFRQFVRPGVSIVDELIAERREEALRE